MNTLQKIAHTYGYEDGFHTRDSRSAELPESVRSFYIEGYNLGVLTSAKYDELGCK